MFFITFQQIAFKPFNTIFGIGKIHCKNKILKNIPIVCVGPHLTLLLSADLIIMHFMDYKFFKHEHFNQILGVFIFRK